MSLRKGLGLWDRCGLSAGMKTARKLMLKRDKRIMVADYVQGGERLVLIAARGERVDDVKHALRALEAQWEHESR